MDDSQLAQQVTTFLVPFLPYLLKAGEEASKEVGKKFTEAVCEKARAMWSKLRLKVESSPAALETVQDVAAMPEKERAQNALAWQLEKLFNEDLTLAAELARLLDEAKAAGMTVIASGDRSVAVGGNVSGSTITTGDQNVVRPGKRNEPDKT